MEGRLRPPFSFGARNRARARRVNLTRRPDTNAPTVSGIAFANWPRPKLSGAFLFGQAETSTDPLRFYLYPLAHGGLRWLLPRAAVNASGVVGLSTAISSRVPMRATLNGVFSQAPRQIRSARRNYASEAFRQRHLRPPHLTNISRRRSLWASLGPRTPMSGLSPRRLAYGRGSFRNGACPSAVCDSRAHRCVDSNNSRRHAK